MARDGNWGETIGQESESETVGTKPTWLQKLCFEAIQSMPWGGIRVPGHAQAVVLQILADPTHTKIKSVWPASIKVMPTHPFFLFLSFQATLSVANHFHFKPACRGIVIIGVEEQVKKDDMQCQVTVTHITCTSHGHTQKLTCSSAHPQTFC